MNNQKSKEYQKKLKVYYIKCIFSEFSKACAFLLIFAYLHLLPEFLVALITLVSLRGIGGGLHFKHYSTCLLVSFIFIFASIFLSKTIPLPLPVVYISIMVCGLIGYFLVPITSTNRPPATVEQARSCKKNTALVITLILILIVICHNTGLIPICYWTVVLHILQLTIAHLKEVKNNV